MSAISLTSPPVLASGLVAQIVTGGVSLNVPTCNLSGTGTFNWLLQFDTDAGTLKTGGAKPVSDPTTGFAFVDETPAVDAGGFDAGVIDAAGIDAAVEDGGGDDAASEDAGDDAGDAGGVDAGTAGVDAGAGGGDAGTQGFTIQPVVYPAALDATGAFTVATLQRLVIPIYTNPAGTSAILLPMQQAGITMGKLSSNNDCIGSYNAAGLIPENRCQPDSTHPLFLTGGSIAGFITLKDADEVPVVQVAQSLCVILTGDPGTYGDGAQPIQHCKRDLSQNIVFQGNWCSTTNAAATTTCADALEVSGTFAASSVLILN
jgi:hypothetical protein